MTIRVLKFSKANPHLVNQRQSEKHFIYLQTLLTISRAVRDAILSSRYRGRIDGFITLHTYSQIWIHPYGHKKDSYPGDVQDLVRVTV